MTIKRLQSKYFVPCILQTDDLPLHQKSVLIIKVLCTLYSANSRSPMASKATRPVLREIIVRKFLRCSESWCASEIYIIVMKIVATRSLLKILTMLEHRTQPLDQIENSSKLPNYCYTAKSIEQNFPNFQLSLQLNMPDQREHVLLKCGKVESYFTIFLQWWIW